MTSSRENLPVKVTTFFSPWRVESEKRQKVVMVARRTSSLKMGKNDAEEENDAGQKKLIFLNQGVNAFEQGVGIPAAHAADGHKGQDYRPVSAAGAI